MKSNLPNVGRLTLREKTVIEWAFNFAHSIVTGDYNLPGPMCYAMKNLHNAVFQLAQKRGTSIADGCRRVVQSRIQKGVCPDCGSIGYGDG